MAEPVPLPIAECRLDVTGLREQADRYRRLGEAATRVERENGSLEVEFGPALDERLLEEAIAVERECCPFFVFARDPGARRLTVTVERPEQAPALDALLYAFTRGAG